MGMKGSGTMQEVKWLVGEELTAAAHEEAAKLVLLHQPRTSEEIGRLVELVVGALAARQVGSIISWLVDDETLANYRQAQVTAIAPATVAVLDAAKELVAA